MLTDENKERILLEETYRLEVRDQLSRTRPSVSRWEKLSPILNSAFVLWLLSSVVLGIAGVVYTKWDAQRTIDRERREHETQVLRENELTARRLDSEIENRLVIFARTYGIVADKEGEIVVFPIYDKDFGTIRKALVELENPSLSEYKMAVFPEYANRTLRSLLFELRDVVPPEQKPEIANAYDKSLVVTEFYVSEMKRNHTSCEKFWALVSVASI